MLGNYDLEINRIADIILKSKAKKVVLQFPDGLKPFATSITNQLREKTPADFYIWINTNFGACDIPEYLKKLGYDLLINIGHSAP